jgi:hypothetical protein
MGPGQHLFPKPKSPKKIKHITGRHCIKAKTFYDSLDRFFGTKGFRASVFDAYIPPTTPKPHRFNSR